MSLIKKILKHLIPRNKLLLFKRKIENLNRKMKPSFTETEFKKLLKKKMGISYGDVVFVHASLGDINLSFSKSRVLEIILEIIGDDGTVLFPAWHYSIRSEEFFNKNPKPFDVNRSRSRQGFLSELARLDKRAIRSLHPTNSIVAIGSEAKEIVKDHQFDIYPCGMKSPFYKLIEKEARIIGLGIDVNSLTFLHCCEDIYPELFKITLRSKEVHNIPVINKNGDLEIVKTLFADKDIIKRDPKSFFTKHISKNICIRFKKKRAHFFSAKAVELNEILIKKAKEGKTIYY